jgi:CheY-like chemotaxis protein
LLPPSRWRFGGRHRSDADRHAPRAGRGCCEKWAAQVRAQFGRHVQIIDDATQAAFARIGIRRVAWCFRSRDEAAPGGRSVSVDTRERPSVAALQIVRPGTRVGDHDRLRTQSRSGCGDIALGIRFDTLLDIGAVTRDLVSQRARRVGIIVRASAEWVGCFSDTVDRNFEDRASHRRHRVAAGEKLFVDFAGDTIDVIEAIALAEQSQPQLAIIDVNLKNDTSGVEVARYMRINLDIPSLFATGQIEIAWQKPSAFWQNHSRPILSLKRLR